MDTDNSVVRAKGGGQRRGTSAVVSTIKIKLNKINKYKNELCVSNTYNYNLLCLTCMVTSELCKIPRESLFIWRTVGRKLFVKQSCFSGPAPSPPLAGMPPRCTAPHWTWAHNLQEPQPTWLAGLG